MSRRLSGLLAGAAFAVYAAAGAGAFAQPAAKAEKAGPALHEEQMMMIRKGGPERDPAEHLRAILQLKPGQEPALQAYLAATKPDHEHMMRLEGPGEAKTTPERLARMEQHLAMMQTTMKAHIDATRRFYDQLDPAQKRAFDEMPMMMTVGGHMGPMPVHMMHHGPMGEPMRMPEPPRPPEAPRL